MWRVFKMVLGIPLLVGLMIVQVLLTVFGFLGSVVTTIIALLMYFTLGMILLFQLQPVVEIAGMSLVATGILLSPLIAAGTIVLTVRLREQVLSWMMYNS